MQRWDNEFKTKSLLKSLTAMLNKYSEDNDLLLLTSAISTAVDTAKVWSQT